MLTIEHLHAIMPRLPSARGTTLFPFLTAAISEFSIERPARTAAFLAQLAHESAQCRFMEEIWGPTAAQRRYEPPGRLAADLGNTEPGDGERFKGRGPIQITGRANYGRFGGLLGVDLIAEPERAARPEVAFRIAGLYWSKKGLNELADQVSPDAFREITRRINGGFNGLAEREGFYEKAKSVLGVDDTARPRGRTPRETLREEPVFERGHEAVRAAAMRAVRRRKRGKKKTAARGAKRKSAARGARRTRATRRVQPKRKRR